MNNHSIRNQNILYNIDLWRERLGLLPVPLHDDASPDQPFILLNGSRGNFCLSIDDDESLTHNGRNVAWSSNVGHFIRVSRDVVEVQRWDREHVAAQKFTAQSVSENLESFHSLLESQSPRPELSIIAHTISVFRSLRNSAPFLDGANALRAFLVLLATVTDFGQDTLNYQHWGLDDQARQAAEAVPRENWELFSTALTRGPMTQNLTPSFALTLRHAAGLLFQEAHYEAIYSQLPLTGFMPSPISVQKAAKGAGSHFTPPALARTLVEEAIRALDLTAARIRIFDPACGSGEFLREALRQLRLAKYEGHIELIGWDISQAACDMANFVLAWETRQAGEQITYSILRKDALAEPDSWPQADVITMNPPFVSWQDMSQEQKELVVNILGASRKRPDLSHAFILQAANTLPNSGVLASILPASFLDVDSAEKTRERLGEILSARLVTRLGSHMLFQNALVDAALYVARKGSDSAPPLAFWADHKPNSASTGLRMLRMLRSQSLISPLPIIGDGFSIYQNPTLGHKPSSWAPRPYNAWRLYEQLLKMDIPKVGDLFNVRQGIRTGDVKTFVISKDDWGRLPPTEKVFFRPAVVNKSIRAGFLTDVSYVFYPFGKRAIETEQQLRNLVQTYYFRFLEPAKAKLLQRARVNSSKWWELSEHRAWQVDPEPKLISTYWGTTGSFAWDSKGHYAVVQGYAWLPKPPLSDRFTEPLGLAYLSLFNSSLFLELISSVSNHVGGGQWDLSSRFVSNIPIPNLLAQSIASENVAALSEMGKRISKGEPIDDTKLREAVVAAYGLNELLQ